MGCHVPIGTSDVHIACPMENLLMVLVIACCLPHTTHTELQNNFIFPDVKWKGVLSATVPCFIAEMGGEHLHSPFLLPTGQTLPSPLQHRAGGDQWKAKVRGMRAAWLPWPGVWQT